MEEEGSKARPGQVTREWRGEHEIRAVLLTKTKTIKASFII